MSLSAYSVPINECPGDSSSAVDPVVCRKSSAQPSIVVAGFVPIKLTTSAIHLSTLKLGNVRCDMSLVLDHSCKYYCRKCLLTDFFAVRHDTMLIATVLNKPADSEPVQMVTTGVLVRVAVDTIKKQTESKSDMQ